jgi:hypothetical protein
MSDEIRRISRHARRAGKFPTDSKCASCPETDPIVLVEGSDPLRCYECQARGAGKSGVEADHFAGAANSPVTLRIPANVHRRRSDRQYDWPRATLENRDGNPLLKIAAMVRGWLDYLQIIVDVLDVVPAALVALNASLVNGQGARWWEQPQFLRFSGVVGNA